MKCKHCGLEVTEFRGYYWTGDDFMCPDGERQHEPTQETRVWVEWWGGNSYAMSYPWEYLEVFPSLEAAKDALVERYETGHWRKQDFEYVNRDPESVETPAVGEDSIMWLWYSKPTQELGNLLGQSEHYPQAVIHLRHARDGVEAYVESV